MAWRPMVISSPSVSVAPLDALAVDVDAVERAVVEHAYAVGLADHERMTARDRRVVEADVGGQRAPDPGPLLVQRRHDVAAGLLVGEVLAGHGEPVASLLQPGGALALHRPGRADGHRLSAAEGQRAGGLDVLGLGRGSVQASLLFRRKAPCRATRPPAECYGPGQWGRDRELQRKGPQCPRRSGSEPCSSLRPPELRAPRRRSPCSATASARWRPAATLLPLPPDAAGRRAGPLLRRAARVRAVPPPAARGPGARRAWCTPPSTERAVRAACPGRRDARGH